MPIGYSKEVLLFDSLKELNEYTEGKYKGCFNTFYYGDGSVEPFDEGFHMYSILFGDFIEISDGNWMSTVLHPIGNDYQVIVLGSLNRNREVVVSNASCKLTKCGTIHLIAPKKPNKAIEVAVAVINVNNYPDWMTRCMKWFEHMTAEPDGTV